MSEGVSLAKLGFFAQWCVPLLWGLDLRCVIQKLNSSVHPRIIRPWRIDTWLGHRLGLLWYWMVCLGHELKLCCHFWDCTNYCISDSFVDHEGYFISSKRFLPTVIYIMVIWIKFIITIQFSSLIPKMSIFNLVSSYLTTSNLPWVVDLTFQVRELLWGALKM